LTLWSLGYPDQALRVAKEGLALEAHAIPTEIHNWFTEGFDTSDLKEAKALLDELSE
jgi:hypothetical protein